MRAGKLLLVVATLAATGYGVRSWRAADGASSAHGFLRVGTIAEFPSGTVVVRGPT